MLAIFQEISDFMRSAWVLWLMIIFCILVARAYWPSRKAKLETFGRIPLEDDPNQANDAARRGDH